MWGASRDALPLMGAIRRRKDEKPHPMAATASKGERRR